MATEIKIELNTRQIIKRICHDNKNGEFLASIWARYMDKYVPFDSGMLANSAQIEPYKVIYPQSYAHRIYEGGNFNFSKEKHPLATAKWDEICAKANKAKVAKEYTEYLKK